MGPRDCTRHCLTDSFAASPCPGGGSGGAHPRRIRLLRPTLPASPGLRLSIPPVANEPSTGGRLSMRRCTMGEAVGLSASSTTTTTLRAASGTPCQDSAGHIPCPSALCRRGRAPPGAKSLLCTRMTDGTPARAASWYSVRLIPARCDRKARPMNDGSHPIIHAPLE